MSPSVAFLKQVNAKVASLADLFGIATALAVANGTSLVTGFLGCAQLPMLWLPLGHSLLAFVMGFLAALVAAASELLRRGAKSMALAVLSLTVVVWSAVELNNALLRAARDVVEFQPLWALAGQGACDAMALQRGEPASSAVQNHLVDEGYTSLAQKLEASKKQLQESEAKLRALQAEAKRRGIPVPADPGVQPSKKAPSDPCGLASLSEK